MTATHNKRIFHEGTLHSKKGRVELTPESLLDYATKFKRMTELGYKVPVSFDHDKDESLPLSTDDYEKAVKNDARNVVGSVDFDVVENDGEHAIAIDFDFRDPQAKQRADENVLTVSPVITKEWMAGNGEKFENVITHVDLVRHPVDYTQTEFKDGSFKKTNGPVSICLSVGDDEEQCEFIYLSSDGEPGSKEGEETSGSAGGRIIAVLQKAGFQIPKSIDPVSSPDIFADVLEAVVAQREHDGVPPVETNELSAEPPEPAGNDGGAIPPSKIDEKPPETITLSADDQKRIDAATGMLVKGKRSELKGRLDELHRSGRCFPHEHKSKAPQVDQIELGIESDGSFKLTELESWIKSREELNRGQCWDQTNLSIVGEPANPEIDTSPEETDEEETSKKAEAVVANNPEFFADAS